MKKLVLNRARAFVMGNLTLSSLLHVPFFREKRLAEPLQTLETFSRYPCLPARQAQSAEKSHLAAWYGAVTSFNQGIAPVCRLGRDIFWQAGSVFQSKFRAAKKFHNDGEFKGNSTSWITLLALFFIFHFSFLISPAQTPPKPALVYSKTLNGPDWVFRENKGQLKDENGNTLNNIPFYGKQGGVNIYCKRGMVSFVFAKNQYNKNDTDSKLLLLYKKFNYKKPSGILFNRIDLELLNANSNSAITASEHQNYYENYYTTGNADSGIVNIQTFKTITYNEIYPNIDLVLQSKPNGLEYYFVIRPGGKVGDIQLQWSGIDSMKELEKGGISYSFPLGNMVESPPVSYQASEPKIQSDFRINNNIISFSIPYYDSTQTLIIDPSLVWGTYYGGGSENATGMVLDSSYNVYISGYTESTSGIATSGAHQTSYGGSNNKIYTGDVFIAKFNSTVTSLFWGTYYGGSGDDYSTGITYGRYNNLYITGITFSNNGIATSGSYKTNGDSINGDAFVAKFNPFGYLFWGTFYGDSGVDESFAITSDTNENLYITGFSSSTIGIATAGSYKTSSALGFVTKFTYSGTLAWGTYYGGSGGCPTEGLAISLDTNKNIVIAGTSLCTKGIATKGAYQTTYGGANDAFVAKFNNSGTSLLWGTYYGGSELDQAYGIATDSRNNIYITGYTESTNGIATSGVFKTSYSDSQDAFVAKFSSTGSLAWGTYFGDSGVEYCPGIVIDSKSNVFITGSTTSTTGIATSGSYKDTITGSYDAFVAELNLSGSKLLYGSYFGGGPLGTAGESIIIDSNNSYIYIAGGTCGTDSIATSGAYKTNYATGANYAFIAKFSFATKAIIANDAGIPSFLPSASSFCTSTQSIKVQLQNYGAAILTSVKISYVINRNVPTSLNWIGKLLPDSTTTVNLGMYNFSVSGTDTIIAYTTLPNAVKDSVPSNDTERTIVTVYAIPIANAGSNTAICMGSATKIGAAAVSGVTFLWSSAPSGFISTLSNPAISPTVTTTYTLIVTNAGKCTDTGSVVITVNPLPKANAGSAQAICLGTSATIGATAVNGDTYSWVSSPSGFTSTNATGMVAPTTTTTYILNETVGTCSKTDSVVITVNPLPKADAGSATTICSGTNATIGASFVNGDSYSWVSSPKGFTSTEANPSVKPTITTTYTLIATNAGKCTDTGTVIITVNPLPAANAGTSQVICFGENATTGASSVNGDSYSWVSTPKGFTSTISNPVVSPTATATYTLTETTTATGCSKNNAVVITVNPLPDTGFSVSATGLTITCTPKNTTYTGYEWHFHDVASGNKDTSTQVKPSHTFSGSGTYWVSLKVTDSVGCEATDSQKIKLITTGINPVISKPQQTLTITLNPNPFSNELLLNITNATDTGYAAQMQVYNALGQPVQAKQFAIAAQAVQDLTIDVSQLKPGFYYVLVNNGSQIVFRQSMIKN